MSDVILGTHPIQIYAALDQVFAGEKWLEYEPETLLLALASEVSDAAIDKLLAVQAVCANTNAVCQSAAAFEKAVNAFNNNVCVMDVLQPPEVEEMSYAVSQIEKLARVVHNKKPVFTGEVPGYVASTAHFRGWFVLPKNLSFAQETLDSLSGLSPETKLYKEHANIVDVVTRFVDGADRKDARELLSNPELLALSKDDASAMLVRRHIGALLYDPTLPYDRGNTN